MRAEPAAIGASVAAVLMALVNDFQLRRRKDILQTLLQLLGGGCCTHGEGVLGSSALKYLAM